MLGKKTDHPSNERECTLWMLRNCQWRCCDDWEGRTFNCEAITEYALGFYQWSKALVSVQRYGWNNHKFSKDAKITCEYDHYSSFVRFLSCYLPPDSCKRPGALLLSNVVIFWGFRLLTNRMSILPSTLIYVHRSMRSSKRSIKKQLCILRVTFPPNPY